MCPTNTTNLEDGSYDCPVAVLPGASLAARYAVIVSFGVYLNGTSLDDIAHKVGSTAGHTHPEKVSRPSNHGKPTAHCLDVILMFSCRYRQHYYPAT